MTDVDFFPITLYPRRISADMLELPDAVIPLVRIAYAADVEPNDVILGDAPMGYRFSGYLCRPFLAAPTEHNQADCWECRTNMANYRPRKPVPQASGWAMDHYLDILESVEFARRHLDGGVIDLATGVHVHVCDRIVVVPAAFAKEVPAVASYQQFIRDATRARRESA
ncbi:hypothetical protein L0F81_22425 [Streptomyces tricolor]|uniref:Uncharacterized protein n=1 Tax=Streptomyces tricolor TaxID=68277 RepID=A0ABS9JKC1_9ACTN|nr:hypothetical protein [Streptomyces tricolor]MCG0066019.1 hypothetical protein [Streptomyces tricolor]